MMRICLSIICFCFVNVFSFMGDCFMSGNCPMLLLSMEEFKIDVNKFPESLEAAKDSFVIYEKRSDSFRVGYYSVDDTATAIGFMNSKLCIYTRYEKDEDIPIMSVEKHSMFNKDVYIPNIFYKEIMRLQEWGFIQNTKEETDSIAKKIMKIIGENPFHTEYGVMFEDYETAIRPWGPTPTILELDELPQKKLADYYTTQFVAYKINAKKFLRKISNNSFLLNKSNVYVKSFDLQGKLIEQKFIQSNVYAAPFLPIILKVENQSAVLLK